MFSRCALFVFFFCTLSIDNVWPNVLNSKEDDNLGDDNGGHTHNDAVQQYVALDGMELCEGQSGEMSCGSASFIRLYSSSINEDVEDICSQTLRSGHSRSSPKTITCSSSRVTHNVNRSCEGKTSCFIKFSDCLEEQQKYVLGVAFFCQPLHSSTKVTPHISYSTLPSRSTFGQDELKQGANWPDTGAGQTTNGSPPNGALQQYVTLDSMELCEGQSGEMSCGSARFIRLYYARIFGDVEGICSQTSGSRLFRNSPETIACSNSRVTSDVTRSCEGKTSCFIKFDDCLEEQRKYVLGVEFSCIPLHSSTTVTPHISYSTLPSRSPLGRDELKQTTNRPDTETGLTTNVHSPGSLSKEQQPSTVPVEPSRDNLNDGSPNVEAGSLSSTGGPGRHMTGSIGGVVVCAALVAVVAATM